MNSFAGNYSRQNNGIFGSYHLAVGNLQFAIGSFKYMKTTATCKLPPNASTCFPFPRSLSLQRMPCAGMAVALPAGHTVWLSGVNHYYSRVDSFFCGERHCEHLVRGGVVTQAAPA
jgi:hypothetical protein